MSEQDIFHYISQAIDSDNIAEAGRLIASARTTNDPHPTLLYLEGKLHMKQSRWSQAISSFLQSEELDPNGPARQCRLMLNDIMAFYNKDMYNQ